MCSVWKQQWSQQASCLFLWVGARSSQKQDVESLTFIWNVVLEHESCAMRFRSPIEAAEEVLS